MADASYNADFYAWANAQADAARRRSANELDWENVAEELEDLGRQQRSKLYSRYVVLLTHLLKWTHQPERRGRSWSLTIKEQRIRVSKLLRSAPSLRSAEAEEFQDAYETARLRAARGTKLEESDFPLEPPFTVEQALDPEFWPEAVEIA